MSIDNGHTVENALRAISGDTGIKYDQTAGHIQSIISKYVAKEQQDNFTKELVELIKNGNGRL